MKYSEQLKSHKWQKKRLEVLSRDNFTCCKCGDTETELHVHHLKYIGNPIESDISDLETLCKHCHQYFTFFNNNLIYIHSLNNEDLIKTHKLKGCLIVEFKSCMFLFSIEEKELILLVTFSKPSSVLKKMYDLMTK